MAHASEKKTILKAMELFNFFTITFATLMVTISTHGSVDVIITTCHAINTRIFHHVQFGTQQTRKTVSAVSGANLNVMVMVSIYNVIKVKTKTRTIPKRNSGICRKS